MNSEIAWLCMFPKKTKQQEIGEKVWVLVCWETSKVTKFFEFICHKVSSGQFVAVPGCVAIVRYFSDKQNCWKCLFWRNNFLPNKHHFGSFLGETLVILGVIKENCRMGLYSGPLSAKCYFCWCHSRKTEINQRLSSWESHDTLLLIFFRTTWKHAIFQNWSILAQIFSYVSENTCQTFDWQPNYFTYLSHQLKWSIACSSKCTAKK